MASRGGLNHALKNRESLKTVESQLRKLDTKGGTHESEECSAGGFVEDLGQKLRKQPNLEYPVP